MFPNRFRTVLACAAVALALATAPASADDQRAKLEGEQPQKTLCVVPVSTALDLYELALTLRKLFPRSTVIVPLPVGHGLLVYGTETEAAEVRTLVKPWIETVPVPQKFAFS